MELGFRLMSSPFSLCASIGTMNLTPPRRGTDTAQTNARSPPGRGRGWVGSWVFRLADSGRTRIIVRVRQSVVAQRVPQRIGLPRPEAKLRVSPPAFREPIPPRHFADGQRQLIHGLQIAIHSLAEVEPFFF